MTATGTVSIAGDGLPPELPADLARRFTAALERLNPGGEPIGLAVSGGPDSMAMLLLAHEVIPGQFEVATVNHGLRPAAADECTLVKAACDDRGIPCAVLTVNVGEGNVQARARLARYAALAHWAGEHGLAAVATAHHMDDQVETFLMRLARGSGVAGLAGVRESGNVPGSDLPLIRPLLFFRRRELAQVLERQGITPAQDPSNADPRFDRVRVRQALASAPFLQAEGIAASAAHLADAGEALEWAASREWAEQVVLEGEGLCYRPKAPRAIRLIVATWIIAQLGQEPRGSAVADLVGRLERGEGGNIGGVLATVKGDIWLFCKEPPRRTG